MKKNKNVVLLLFLFQIAITAFSQTADVNDSAGKMILFTGFVNTPVNNSEKEQLGAKGQEFVIQTFGRNFYLTPDTANIRLYTFLRDAMFEYEEKKYKANEKGVVDFNENIDFSKVKILGKEGDSGEKKYPLVSTYNYSNRKIAGYHLGSKK